VGAGAGGLSAALHLAAAGLEVDLVEAGGTPGGKMRELPAGNRRLDAGPTVFTMRDVFEEIFAEAGERFTDSVRLHKADRLARHAWDGRPVRAQERLDLHADHEASVDAIAAFAGPAEARRYRAFCAEARRIYDTLERPFLRQPRATPMSLVRQAGVRRMTGIKPFSTLWDALGKHFHDPRLRQLFGRYATYCGSSPFEAPATLMLVAHVEQSGVWLIDGGMHRLAQALAELARRRGVRVHYESPVAEIEVRNGAATGVRLQDGRRFAADAVVANTDVSAIGSGLLGAAARKAVEPTPPAQRSLSAMTFTQLGEVTGDVELLRHNVFFSAAYKREFDEIFKQRKVPEQPTVYLCAQDREGDAYAADGGGERLFALINAPADGDTQSYDGAEAERCRTRAFALMARCGLEVRPTPETVTTTTPSDFASLYPGTGGALYGRASHGWQASFQRPGVRSRLPGLYLASGSAHPGPGVPMAALSGRLAAQCLLGDLGVDRPVAGGPA
jgi:1-hydroxycarotenoid 3,4-desaturase